MSESAGLDELLAQTRPRACFFGHHHAPGSCELGAHTRRASQGQAKQSTSSCCRIPQERPIFSLTMWRSGARPFPRLGALLQIVEPALCGAVGPLLDRGLIADTYACRVGLGTHAAVRRAVAWARTFPFFVHLDVRKLFPSIDHALLLAQLERDVPCERTLAMVRAILEAPGEGVAPGRFHFPGDDLFSPWARPVGLPIGSLTSQHFANRFLADRRQLFLPVNDNYSCRSEPS